MSGPSLPNVVAGALLDLFESADETGYVPGRVARGALRIISRASRAERAAAMHDPEQHFGPFDGLSEAAQRGILWAFRQRDWIRVRRQEPGAVHLSLMHPLFRLKKRAYAQAASSRGAAAARQVIDTLAFGVRRLPFDANLAWDRLESQARVRLGRIPSLAAVLSVAGIDIRPLAACYARPIGQPSGYRGYWHDATAKRTVGVAAGIDFLPTDEGLRFVECNINFAQRAERSALYETDPYVENLLDFAVEQGYRRLTVVDSGAIGIDPATAQRFEMGARARGLALTLVDRENVPDSKYQCRYSMPPIETPDTLQVRTRSYPIALAYVADMKRASVRVLERYQEIARDPALLLLQSGSEPLLGHVAPGEPFPNVVYKLTEIDQARGVYFLKAESAEHARRILGDA